MLTVEDIAKLLQALDVPMERLVLELTLTTGIRSGEVRGLVWDCLDFRVAACSSSKPLIARARPGLPRRSEASGPCHCPRP